MLNSALPSPCVCFQGQESQSPQHCSRHLKIPAGFPGYSQRCVSHQESTALAWEDTRTHRNYLSESKRFHFGPETNFLAFLFKHDTRNFTETEYKCLLKVLGFLVRYAQRTSRFKVFMGFTFCCGCAGHGSVSQNYPQNPLLLSHML